MQGLRRIVAYFGIMLACASGAAASCEPGGDDRAMEGPMRFYLAEGDARGAEIIATGRITDDTAAIFTAFLQTLETPPQRLVLNSLGGRVQGGLALGRAIRDAGLATRVSGGEDSDCPEGGTATAPRRGVCLSSCAYAFLGGTGRDVTATGTLGFHRIYPAAGQAEVAPAQLAVATARMQAEIRSYLADMGADPRLVDIAETVAPDRVYVPSGALMATLGIETGPIALAALRTTTRVQQPRS